MECNMVGCFQADSERVWSLAWSPDGARLATCGQDCNIKMWSESPKEQWNCLATLNDLTHSRTVRGLSWSPDSVYLAAASFDSTVSVWTRRTATKSPASQDAHDSEHPNAVELWKCVVCLKGHENEVKSVAWSSDGKHIATCGRDKTVWIHQLDLGDQAECDFNVDTICAAILSGHTQDVKFVLWHPTEEILLSASYDDTIKMWGKTDDDDWGLLQTLTGHMSTVWSLAFNADGSNMVSGSDDCTIKIWNRRLICEQTWKPGQTLNSYYMFGVFRGLPTGYPSENKQRLWSCVATLQGYTPRTIYSVSWSKHHDWIACGGGDDTLIFFCRDADAVLEGGSGWCLEAKVEDAHTDDINCVFWRQTNTLSETDGNGQDSQLLATCGDDKMVRIWRVGRGCPVRA